MLRFGTDGVRGRYGTKLTENYVCALARSVASVLKCDAMVLARDTRESGPNLESAIANAIGLMGVKVELMGVAPTPALAYLCAHRNRVGMMITASHNPFQDNGVKVFAAGGRKLSDQQQSEIEEMLLNEFDPNGRFDPDLGANLATDCSATYINEYLEFMLGVGSGTRLDRLRIVIDCANGATSAVAGTVLRQLGAEVTEINTTPNGRNINENCGAIAPQVVGRVVLETAADLGIAFDGDGDRAIAVDHKGQIIDGDQLLAINAMRMKNAGALRHNTVVVTVMTNIGFHMAMKEAKIDVLTTEVGDRSILGELEGRGLSLGGEQSGHVIFRDIATTGDGLLVAVNLACQIAKSDRTLAELATSAMTVFPQVLVNVPNKMGEVDIASFFNNEIQLANTQLEGIGRVLVRSSGTEPVIRVMVEASSSGHAEFVANSLAQSIAERLDRKLA